MQEHYDKVLEKLKDRSYIIKDLLTKPGACKEAFDDLYNCMKQGFEEKSIREHPIYFRFTEESELRSMELRHFVTNLVFWRAHKKLGVVELDESFIFDCSRISQFYIRSYINDKIIPFSNNVKIVKLYKICDDIRYDLAQMSNDFLIIMGMSISVETFMDVANENKRFDEIIRTKLDDNMQPNEIEEYLDGLMHEEIKILSTEENSLRSILRSGTGIKDKQLSEFSINVGMKPDLSGKTIPIPINTNFLIGGLGNVSSFYIDSLGSFCQCLS